MKKAVFGLATSDEQASRMIDRLLSSGFSSHDISALYPDPNRGKITPEPCKDIEIDSEEFPIKSDVEKENLTLKKHSKSPEGGTIGAATGGVMGGSLGLLAGIGALAIPGLGPLIAAGPIMGALSGSAVGSGIGFLIGALVGSGIPRDEAERYGSRLKGGNILISVHIDRIDADKEVNRATEIMKEEGAEDISSISLTPSS